MNHRFVFAALLCLLLVFQGAMATPTPTDLVYNGESQPLFEDTEGEDGWYSKNGTRWTQDIPEGTKAGEYTFLYTADENPLSADAVKVEITNTIEPLEVDLVWEPDEFEYDGKSHAPTATVDNLAEGDTCRVTVEGAQTDASEDAYTATAVALSNPNYVLPEEPTWDFYINPIVAELEWSGSEFTYNGQEQAPTARVTNLVSGDKCTVTVEGAETDASEDAYTATATELSNPNYILPDEVEQEFYINPIIAVLGWKDTEFTYDGEEHAPTATVTNLLDGDECEVTVDGAEIDASDEAYTAEASELSNSNYVLPEEATQDFTISPLEAELEWEDTEFEYDGEEHVPTATVVNLVDGDDCEVTVEGAQTDASSSPYTATATELSNENYKLPAKATQEFTISPLEAELEWEDTEFEYDGEEHVPTATVVNLVDGDECDVTVSGAKKDANAEGETYTAAATGLSNSNYVLPEEATQEFTISPLVAELEWGDTEFTYDGKEHAPTATVANLVEGDSCTVTVEGAETDANEDAYTATATELSNSNYVLPDEVDQEFTISPVEAELKWENTEFTYDGEEHAPTATVTNLMDGDECEVTVDGAETDASDEAYTATATELSNSNYVLPEEATQEFTISPLVAELEWEDTEFEYDGEEHVPTATVANLVDGDDCEVTVEGAETDASDDAYTATATELSNSNYVLPEKATQEFTISPLVAELEWEDTEFEYDGEEHVPTATVVNLVDGDECEVTVSGAQKNANAEGETYTATATALSNPNYKLPDEVTQEFTISPIEAEIEWENTEFEYDGKEHAPTATVTNLLEGDECEVTVEGAEKDASEDPYTAEATALSNGNYKLPEEATQEFTISPLEAELEWKNTEFTYDGEEHVPTATVTNLVEGDSCEVTVEGAEKDASDEAYTATATELSNSNYVLPDEVDQEFTISPLEAELKWEDTEFTYDGEEHVPTATVANLVDGDECEVTVEGAETNASDEAYTAIVTELSNSNYKLPEEATQEFTINPLEAELEWEDTEFTYDGEEHAPTATVANLVDGDDCDVTVEGAKKDASSSPYTATATELSNSNYKLPADPTQSFTIEPLEAELEWEETEFTYDGEKHAPTATVSNLVDGDECEVTVSGAQTNANKEGETYTATATALSNSNYKLPEEATQEFTIAKADITEEDFIAPEAIEGLEYNAKDQTLITAGKWVGKAMGTFKYQQTSYAPKDVDSSEYSTSLPTGKDAGDYTIEWIIEGDANHNDYGPETLDAEIAKKEIDASMVLLSPRKVYYDGEEHTVTGLVRYGSDRLGEDEFELEGELEGTEIGEYAVTVTVSDDCPNYTGSVDVVWVIVDHDPMPTFTMYRIGDSQPTAGSFCERECLPGTGFPTVGHQPLSVKPEGLTYVDLGMRIQIPRLELDVELTGVPEVNGAWAVEWLDEAAGLLSGTALPGKGYSMIAGHNHLDESRIGPFALLSYLEENDVIFVNAADGGMTRFSVYANELVAPNDMITVTLIAEQEENTLVLVTCENEAAGGGYLNRRVIFAKPLN